LETEWVLGMKAEEMGREGKESSSSCSSKGRRCLGGV
jgi:hypothetical protein